MLISQNCSNLKFCFLHTAYCLLPTMLRVASDPNLKYRLRAVSATRCPAPCLLSLLFCLDDLVELNSSI